MNLRNIDLNLLVIFDAIVAERSITRAAKKIGISQSAVSHALGRLRQTFKDDLVRRTSRGMEPTARALNISKSVQAALKQIEEQRLTDYATLRTALDTVAVNADDGLSRAQEQLIELAAIARPAAP